MQYEVYSRASSKPYTYITREKFIHLLEIIARETPNGEAMFMLSIKLADTFLSKVQSYYSEELAHVCAVIAGKVLEIPCLSDIKVAQYNTNNAAVRELEWEVVQALQFNLQHYTLVSIVNYLGEKLNISFPVRYGELLSSICSKPELVQAKPGVVFCALFLLRMRRVKGDE